MLAWEHGETLAARSAALYLSSEDAAATMPGQLLRRTRLRSSSSRGRAQTRTTLADANGQRTQAALF
eukprot:8631473-Pyramimonas_sp.AAC.1